MLKLCCILSTFYNFAWKEGNVKPSEKLTQEDGTKSRRYLTKDNAKDNVIYSKQLNDSLRNRVNEVKSSKATMLTGVKKPRQKSKANSK